jgi:hypothetical protein
MKSISREAVLRWFNGESVGAGGGVGFDPSMISGLAQQSWVEENFVSIEWFDQIFQVFDDSTKLDVNAELPMDQSKINIKAMFGFWTNLYISALGSNGAAPAGISLGMLTDVNITGTPSAGQVLTFDAVSGKWVNGNAQAGVTALANLTDVTLTTPLANQVLLYDGGSSKWINSDLKTINGQSLLGSGDISVGGGASGNYLPLTGGTLTNSRGDILNINSTNVGAWIYYKINSTNVAASGYYLDCCFISNERNGYRLGVTDNGYPIFRLGSLTSDTTYELLHSGNWSRIINPYYSEQQPGYTVYRPSGWAWIRLDETNVLWDLSMGSSTEYRTNYGFAVRDNGSSAGIYVQHDTSDYGKLQIHVPSGECSLGFYSNLQNIWTIGARSDGAFGFYYTPSSPGWKVYFSSNGTGNFVNVYASGYITALSDARKKDITGEAGVTVEQIAHAPAVQFLWKDKERRKDGQQVGTLAQYWQTVLPEVVMDKGGELSMQYGVAALVSAIVTARKVVDHELRIAELEKENERLKEEIEQLRLN